MGSGGMRWLTWIDRNGTLRLGGRLGRRLRRHIRLWGLPGRLRLREDGWVRIEVEPRPGWRHLSRQRDVEACYRAGYSYRITVVCWMAEFRASASAVRRLDRIRAWIGSGRTVHLPISYVNPRSSVVSVRTTPGTALHSIVRDLTALRALYGNHTGDITISM